MYRKNQYQTSKQTGNQSYEAEQLKKEIARYMSNGDELDQSAPIIYTERKDGVINQYNIRRDKWDEAAEGMDKVAELNLLQREARRGEREYDNFSKEEKAAFNKKFPNNKHALAEKQGGDL